MTKEEHDEMMNTRDSRISNLESLLSGLRTELDTEREEKTNIERKNCDAVLELKRIM